LIFRNHKCIYFHIGKTAGTAVERWLGDGVKRDPNFADFECLFGYHRDMNLYLQHANIALAKKFIHANEFNHYYKFSVVRNPFERLLSVYHYLYDHHEEQFGGFENYILDLPNRLKNIEMRTASHHALQTSYTHLDGVQICDHIAYFELLPESLQAVAKQLGISVNMQKHNTHRFYKWGEKPVSDYYSPQMRDLVIEHLADEFECYGYSTNIEIREPLITHLQIEFEI